MRSTEYKKLIFIIPFLWGIGCSSYHYWAGKSLIESQQFQSAIPKLMIAEGKAPKDFKPKRELGIAYYHLQNYADALAKLNAAKQLKTDDGLTAYYLGQTYEALGNLDSALAEYTRFSDFGLFSEVKPLIQSRIQQLLLQKISNEIKTAVRQEQALKIADVPENSIAILYFKNINQWPRLTPLEKGLAHMLITDLSKIRALQLVERLKLERLMQEIELSQSDLFVKETTPRLGKLLGARQIIKGGFTSNEEGQIEIVTAIVESESGDLAKPEITMSGRIHDFFTLEKQLVFKIIQTLGIRPSFAEIEAIKKYPTQNLLAYLAFAEGMNFEDRGDLLQARQSYQKALAIDPNFTEARNQMELTRQSATSSAQVTRKIQSIDNDSPEQRLMATGENVGRNSLPATTEAPTIIRPKAATTVVIRGNLPVLNNR